MRTWGLGGRVSDSGIRVYVLVVGFRIRSGGGVYAAAGCDALQHKRLKPKWSQLKVCIKAPALGS